jgi:thiamine biosynthesis lipoprotein
VLFCLDGFERTEEAMGTTFGVTLFGADRSRLEAAAADAFAELHRLDAMLSNYRPDSEWSRVNREAGSRPSLVSAELLELLSTCLEYSRQSEGAFDITVGPLMKIWKFYRSEGQLPRRADVAAALHSVGYQHVRLDRATQTVRFALPGVELDPGGVGKGYAVDRMVAVLRRHGVERALVSASGSSVYGLGAPPHEPRGWRMALRHPRDPGWTAGVVFLQDESLATSGDYAKFFWANGRRYSHLMDPRTGYPAQGTAAVTVIGPLAVESEAWTKPFIIRGRSWTAAHKPARFRVFFCEDSPSTPCAWIPDSTSSPRDPRSPARGTAER